LGTCREAIEDVFRGEEGILSTDEVISRVYALHPEKPWKQNTIGHHLVGLSVNHPSSRHHPNTRKHAFLFSLGNGRYRKWNPHSDGTWEITSSGVQLIDLSTDAVESEDEAGIEEKAVGVSLSLERDLERSLLGDLEQLEEGLSLYNEQGVIGHQLETGDVGRLDILATGSDGASVVIELKSGEADERALAQVLRYMGWVARRHARNTPVRGILVANSFHSHLIFAAGATRNIRLVRYQTLFRFEDVPIEITGPT